jgi:hypothetical protein
MRSLVYVAIVGLFGCEQRFSADPPLVPESPAPTSSSSAIDALFAPITTDAASDRGFFSRDDDHHLLVEPAGMPRVGGRRLDRGGLPRRLWVGA